MKRWLLLAVLAMPVGAAHAGTPTIRCPGETTMEMRYCAGKSLAQSDAKLRQKITKQLYNQWQDATRALCAAAYASYKDGTIYPQLVIGCDDNLNRALLKEFQPMGN